jgi:hypothetical protein
MQAGYAYTYTPEGGLLPGLEAALHDLPHELDELRIHVLAVLGEEIG